MREYGEDSDFVRVRLRGLPPSASELQFIDSARIYAAQKRLVEVLDDEPLIAGFDVSGRRERLECHPLPVNPADPDLGGGRA